jgi:hypothetical protein
MYNIINEIKVKHIYTPRGSMFNIIKLMFGIFTKLIECCISNFGSIKDIYQTLDQSNV